MVERHPSVDPVHPGEILREDVLPVLVISKTAIWRRPRISRQTLYEHSERETAGDSRDSRALRQVVWQRCGVLGQSPAHLRSGTRRAGGRCLRNPDARSTESADRIVRRRHHFEQARARAGARPPGNQVPVRPLPPPGRPAVRRCAVPTRHLKHVSSTSGLRELVSARRPNRQSDATQDRSRCTPRPAERPLTAPRR